MHEVVGETFLHFLIGEAEGVNLKFLVVVLDSQVTALIDDGNGIVVDGVDGIEHV